MVKKAIAYGACWQRIYNPNRFHRLPARLLTTSELLIPHLVDEIAYQTRRNLAQQALHDIIPFLKMMKKRFKPVLDN
ncbi:MAG UNVERIFIED_CONTAM: hypothetical protein LVR29_24945 [Microcystis novacekii LVE1205-3]